MHCGLARMLSKGAGVDAAMWRAPDLVTSHSEVAMDLSTTVSRHLALLSKDSRHVGV